MIYVAINHITDDGADYYKFKSLHRACQYISDMNISSWSMMDQPFLDDNYELIPSERYQLVD